MYMHTYRQLHTHTRTHAHTHTRTHAHTHTRTHAHTHTRVHTYTIILDPANMGYVKTTDSSVASVHGDEEWHIYTTKIDGVVCPPNISETVAVRTAKLAHRPRIASTTIKLISKPIFLSIL